MDKKNLHLQKMLAIVGGMPRYIRKGKCIQCGQCCVNEDCEHFIFVDGKGFCTTHDNSRPMKCKLFPQCPPIIFKKCGYYFIDKVDNKKLGYMEI